MPIVISSPNIKSNALKNLAEKLSEKLGYRVWRVTPDRVGNRRAVSFLNGIDKITQFNAFRAAGVSCPNYTTDYNTVKDAGWKKTVVRAIVNGQEGRGISIIENGFDIPEAPLYTEYVPKKKEFRVHVWNNEVIDVEEKRRRRGTDGDSKVRNTANGYVFCRGDIVEPDNLRDTALAAVRALGRSYGGVDVIWNETKNQCYVLEVNSRPGMEGTTVEKYADAIVRSL